MSYEDVRASGSFGGIGNVRRYGGKVNELPKMDAYTLHKTARVRFPKRKTYSKGISDLFQIDLVDVSNISSHNDGYRYLLTCIDVFTKHAWAIPVKTKTGRDGSVRKDIVGADVQHGAERQRDGISQFYLSLIHI